MATTVRFSRALFASSSSASSSSTLLLLWRRSSSSSIISRVGTRSSSCCSRWKTRASIRRHCRAVKSNVAAWAGQNIYTPQVYFFVSSTSSSEDRKASRSEKEQNSTRSRNRISKGYGDEDDLKGENSASTTTNSKGNDNIDNHDWEYWKQQLRSPPNLITVTRILSTPLLSYWIITQHTTAAVAGCLIAAVSDFADGYLARHSNMSTTLGTYLDPLADKILINVLAVSLWVTGTLPTALVGLWLAKDVGLMTATYRHVAQNTVVGESVLDTPLQVHPTTISKVNTCLQFTTLALGIGHPALVELAATSALADPTTTGGLIVTALAGPTLPALCWVTGVTTVASLGSYVMGGSAFSAVTVHSSSQKQQDNDDEKKNGR